MRKRAAAVVVLLALVAVTSWWLAGRTRRPETVGPGGAGRAAESAPAPAPGLAAVPAGPVGGPDSRAGTPPHGAGGPPSAPLEEETAEPASNVTFRLDAVDATTGAALGASWRRRRPFDAGLEISPGPGVAEEPVILPTGVARRWHIDEARSLRASLVVRAPAGYAAFESAELRATIAAGVRRARAVVPLHRETILSVHVLGPDGRPAEGARIQRILVAGETLGGGPWLVDARGEVRVGIPFLPGEPVLAGVEWQPEHASPDFGEAVAEPEEGIVAPEVRTVVPDDPGTPWSALVRLHGPTAHLPDHFETDNDVSVEEDLDLFPDVPRGRVRARFVGPDGAPILDGTVNGHGVDARGEAVIRDVPAGRCEIQGRAPGHLDARVFADVRRDGEVEVVLREPVGARLDVVVTDEDGRPRPFARLLVTGGPVFDVVDGVQRIDTFTDALGRRSFARVQPTTLSVRAGWGTRWGLEKVTLKDGERSTLRIVAK